MSAPNWPKIAANLLDAVASTQNAFQKTRRLKHKLSTEEARRLTAFQREMDRYLQQARQAINGLPSGVVINWRPIILNLFRTHSLVWEKLWLEHEIGIPASFGSSRSSKGAIRRRIVTSQRRSRRWRRRMFGSITWSGMAAK